MPFFLRKISRAKWNALNGDIPADALNDLKTSNNKLSFWKIDDHKQNLDQIVTALASMCDEITNLDYVLLDENLFSNIKQEKTIGITCYHQANQWHVDLVELTVGQIVQIAQNIFKHPNCHDRKDKRELISLLSNAVKGQKIDMNKLKEKVREKLEK